MKRFQKSQVKFSNSTLIITAFGFQKKRFPSIWRCNVPFLILKRKRTMIKKQIIIECMRMNEWTVFKLCSLLHSNPVKTDISQWKWASFYWIFSEIILSLIEMKFCKHKYLHSAWKFLQKILFAKFRLRIYIGASKTSSPSKEKTAVDFSCEMVVSIGIYCTKKRQNRCLGRAPGVLKQCLIDNASVLRDR